MSKHLPDWPENVIKNTDFVVSWPFWQSVEPGISIIYDRVSNRVPLSISSGSFNLQSLIDITFLSISGPKNVTF